MNQVTVRERLICYLAEKGVRLSHISKSVGTPDYILRKFKAGKKEMWPDHLAKLDEFLQGEHY